VPRCIKYFPGVVLDVILSSATEHLDAESLVKAPSVIPTVAISTDLPIGPVDAPDSPADAPAHPPVDFLSKDKPVEGLRIASASADIPIDDDEIGACNLSTDSSVLSSNPLPFKRVLQLASKRAKKSDSQVQMQELRGDMAQILVKQEEIKQLQKQELEKQDEVKQLQKQALDQQKEMKQLQEQALEGQEKMDRLQNEMKQLQIQNQEELRQMHDEAMGQLAVLQSRVQAVLTQTFELHEYKIPRLFIVLPQDPSRWDAINPFSSKFRLYFLYECGEHTKSAKGKTTFPHHIHLAKHEGYEIARPSEFFRKYGSYVLTVLKMLKFGITVAG
ncbi:hypothetical protein BGZ98_004882, partial [Dissophora globulifera]